VDVPCQLRRSVCTEDFHWVIWNYDDARIEWISLHERSHVRIRQRETPIERAPVLVKRLSYIRSGARPADRRPG
jgi:hypothetical protein